MPARIQDAIVSAGRAHVGRLKAAFWSTFSLNLLLLTVLSANVRQAPAAVNNPTDANLLAREVIENEIEAEINDHSLWSYRELTKRKGDDLLLEYCQTKYGTIHRLLALDGHPLDARQRQAEDQRIQKLIRSPDALLAAQKKESADAQEERRFLQLFPQAFRYQEEQRQGDLVKLRFTPNPDFHPSRFEQHVLHALEGTMVLDVKQQRLVSINGRLTTEVKFWGGLLGHLDAGGTFSVTLENVAPGDWELKSLHVEMDGKALFFKTITVREQDTYSGYTPVAPDTTLGQAAERLRQDSHSWAGLAG